MQFTWDETKAETNARKHGVTFEEASTVLNDPNAINRAQHHAGELRLSVLGCSAQGNCLFVVIVELDEDEELIRIISARKADRHEKAKYQKGLGGR